MYALDENEDFLKILVKNSPISWEEIKPYIDGGVIGLIATTTFTKEAKKKLEDINFPFVENFRPNIPLKLKECKEYD